MTIDWLEGHLERRGRWYVAAASLPYFLLTALTAHRRSFWYDEFFTFYVARQERAADVLRSLAAGADIHPPLDYLLRHFSMRWLGAAELPDRLPSLLAFWVMCLALRHMVAARCGAVLGMAALMAPVVTLAYEYSYDGRAYALMLAGSAVALAAWRAAAEGRRRPGTLALMAAGIATAVTAHYYGGFVLVPLAAGEAVRAIGRRKVDVPLALVAAGSAAFFFLDWPYLTAQSAQVGTFWNEASLTQSIEAYWWLLNEATLVVPIFLSIAAVLYALDRGATRETRAPAAIPAHEWAAAIGALLVPAACYVVARFGTGVFYYRYLLLAVAGAVLLGAYLAHHALAGDARLRAALLAAVALAGLYELRKTEYGAVDPRAGRARQQAVDSMLPDDGLPVVYGTRTGFMEATFYGRPANFPRTYSLTSGEASLKWEGNDNGQRALTNIAPLLPGHVVDYETFLRGQHHFLLINPQAEKTWLLPQLLADGASVSWRAVSNGNVVLEVAMPATASDRAEPAE